MSAVLGEAALVPQLLRQCGFIALSPACREGPSDNVCCHQKKWQTSVLGILRKEQELCPSYTLPVDLVRSHQNHRLETGGCAD